MSPSPQNRTCDFHRIRLKRHIPLTVPQGAAIRVGLAPGGALPAGVSLRSVYNHRWLHPTFPSICILRPVFLGCVTRPTSAPFRVGYYPIWRVMDSPDL